VAHDGKTIADEMSDGIPRRDAVDSSKLGRGTSVDRYVILYELGV
jgi:hypothetical protein